MDKDVTEVQMNTQDVQGGRIAADCTGLKVGPVAYQQGATLLLVEDSRLTSDAIRLMLRATPGRMRRADTLCRARRHLALYAPDVVIIDLGLPDGSGLELIHECARRQPRVPLILAISGQPEQQTAAYQAGADQFLAKPIANIAQFRAALAPSCFAIDPSSPPLSCWAPDIGAMRDDCLLALDLLQGPNQTDRRRYALQFIEGLARSLQDSAMLGAVHCAQSGAETRQLVAILSQRLRAQPLL